MKSSSFGLSNDTFFAFWVALVVELEYYVQVVGHHLSISTDLVCKCLKQDYHVHLGLP